MILLFDIGNSRIKWGCWAGDDIYANGAGDWRQNSAVSWLDKAIEGKPEQILACNVSGDDNGQALELYCLNRWGLMPKFLQSSQQAAGVKNAYNQPTQLGADRWAGILAANNRYNGPVAVISCGTAITIDFIKERGQYCGGIIYPGLKSMALALARDTHQLNLSQGEPKLFANCTADGIAGGTLAALLGGIEWALNQAEQRWEESMQCVLTGGDAPLVAESLQRKVNVCPQLILEGLLVAEGITLENY